MTRRAVQQVEVWVDGLPTSRITPNWGGLKHSTREHGSWEASWTIAVKPHQRPPALHFGASVEIKLGPLALWSGTLAEPNWDSGEMIALGASREAESTPALTSGGASTTKPNTAIDAAIARGSLSWTRVGDFGTTAVGEADEQGGVYTIESLLDAWAEESLSGWRVDENRRLVIETPTEDDPKWFVVPGSGVLGSADEERVDRVVLQYKASTNGRLGITAYPAFVDDIPDGGIERLMDVTDRGKMTLAKAEDIAEAEWNKLRGRSGWTNGLSLSPGQITTKGGVRPDLALIRAGEPTRLLGVQDVRGLAQNTDVIIGDTEYDWEADTVQVNPVGLAARDEESALEEVGQIAASASKKAAAASASAAAHDPVTGSVVVNVTASVTGSAAIVFPTGRFDAAPVVQGTAATALWNVAIGAITTTGANVAVRHIDGTSSTTSVSVGWTAVDRSD